MALTVASPGNQQSLAAVRAWWRVTHPAPSLAQRLDVLYTTAIVIAIFGALAYGTASSALAQVVTAHRLAVFGPTLAMIAVLAAARWGAYQGPVVFSLADVAHLLGAPLPRRGLAARRLAVALAAGGVAGAVASAVVIVGLAGRGRGVSADQAAGLTVGLAELGVLAVAAAWAVQRSARCERAVRRASWPVVLGAAALALGADSGQVARRIALWSGPWGWAVQSGASVRPAERLAALLTLTLVTAAAAAAAIRDSGGCPTERHLRRAEGRASAIASLTSLDARTARQAIEAVGARPTRSPGDLSRLRAAIASRGARPSTRTLAIVWRDAVATVRAPGRAVEAAALASAGTVLCLLNATHPVAVAAAMILVYLGASRMLWPLRSELDMPSRARVLLRPRIGRVLLAHTLIPLTVISAAASLAAAGCAILGGLPAHGVLVALAAVAAAPIVTCCAAMSARRGGRLPQTLLITATATDPSGGGVVILSWLAYWPIVAVVLGGVPVLLITRAGANAGLVAAWTVLATAALAYFNDRDHVER
jgi:hypothetical protein